jgi:hypothetical protein
VGSKIEAELWAGWINIPEYIMLYTIPQQQVAHCLKTAATDGALLKRRSNLFLERC